METVGAPATDFDLFTKVGPLPAWVWGAVAVGGYMWWSHSNSATVAANLAASGVDATGMDSGYGTENADPSSTDYLDTSGSDGSTSGYDYRDVNQGDYGGTVSGSQFTSNQEWSVYAIQQLIAAGTGASVATTAITRYLSGQPLTPAESQAVTLALSLIGPPPLPLPLVPMPPVTGGGGSTGKPGTFVMHAQYSAKTGEAKLTWTRSRNATSYILTRNGQQTNTFSGGTTSYTTGKMSKGRHVLQLQALNAAGQRHSNTVTVTVK